MECCSVSNPRKKLKKDQDKEINNVRLKSLLSLFIEYAWNERDRQISDSMDVELTNWMTTVNIDINNENWISSPELDIRTESRIQLSEIEIENSNKDVQTARDFNNKIVCAQLAYDLKKFLPTLINCQDNINYTDEDGRTVFHVLLEGHREIAEIFSEDQLSRTKKLIEELMLRGGSIYVLDKRGKCPLHIAAMCKHKQILEVMISCMINVNDCDEEGNTALHIILENCIDTEQSQHKDGYVDIIRNLVSRGADTSDKNKKGLTAVHLAARKFHVEVLKLFADNGADIIKHLSNENETALHLACKSPLKLRDTSKMVETIDFLVGRAGCEIEAVDEKGNMPLHCAAEFSSVEVVERLIELGARVNCRTINKLLTPLHSAAKADRLDVMRKLIEMGADVNAEAADGATPIFMSTLLGSYESMKYLIEQGADLYRRDKLHGYTLLHMAAHGIEPKQSPNYDASESEKLEKGVEKFNYLIEKKFDVNDPGTCNVTPLHLAVLALNVNVVKSLIEHGADVNFQSEKSELTALHFTSILKNLITAEMLIKAGADVNCRGGPEQWTPLYFVLAPNLTWKLGSIDVNVEASYREVSSLIDVWPRYSNNLSYRYFDIMTMLIKNGADINARDTFGRSPLHFAALRASSRSSKSLLLSSAYVNVQDNLGQLPLWGALQINQVHTLKKMLNFGADINDEDISQQIMNGKDNLRIAALEHVIKIKLLGLPIAKIYESPIQDLTFTDFYDRCLKEIESLKNYKLADLSLYQFLRMNVKRQYFLAEQISSLHESLEKLFPIYFGIIRGASREAINRKPLLESARIAWAQVSNVYLPDVCVENILSYINNRYLDALVVSAETDENILGNKNTTYALDGRARNKKCVFDFIHYR